MDEKKAARGNLLIDSCEMLSLLDYEGAGKVIHAIADYFIDGELPEGLQTFTKNERRAYNRIKRKGIAELEGEH